MQLKREKVEYFEDYVKTIKSEKPKQGEILDALFQDIVKERITA